MDPTGVPGYRSSASQLERTRLEIEAAISLLRLGVARRVQLCGFDIGPGMVDLARARARDAGVPIDVAIIDDCPTLTLARSDQSGRLPRDGRVAR
jgi:hypothetical protein